MCIYRMRLLKMLFTEYANLQCSDTLDYTVFQHVYTMYRLSGEYCTTTTKCVNVTGLLIEVRAGSMRDKNKMRRHSTEIMSKPNWTMDC